MPAICPPVSPRVVAAAAAAVVAAPLLVADALDDAVRVLVTIGCNAEDAITGKTTPVHRVVVFEKTQHESVALGELAAQ